MSRSALIAALALLLAARPAYGHALYERSTPAAGARLEAPGQIQVTFTEEVEPSFSKLEVLDSSRKRVDLDDSRDVLGQPRALIVSVPELPDGTYTVSWKVLSAVDGHVTRGVFPLVVGAGGLSGALEESQAYIPLPIDVASRWLGYLALMALAGGFIFRLAVMAPGVAASRLGRERQAELLASYDNRFRQRGMDAGVILIAATAAGMVAQAANAADVSFVAAFGEPLLRLLGTRLGFLWQGRLALAVILLLLLWRADGRVLRWGGLIGSAALLGLVSVNSHAAAMPTGAWLAVALDWLHQAGAAAWVGGLFAFALLCPPILRGLKSDARVRLLSALIPRFSTLALISVAVLGLTGTFQAWLQVSSWPAFRTLYGYSLIAKLALIAPMLALGGANLLIVRPRLAAAIAARARRFGPAAARLVQRFRWAVLAEAILGVGVLIATALLTASEPARETYARQPRPIVAVGMAEDIGVNVRIAPGRPGANAFEVRLDDGRGQPPADIQRVTLRFTYLDQDLGSGTLVLEPRGGGAFGAVGSNLSAEGNWQIEAIVRQRGRDDVRAGFRSPILSPESAGQPPSLEAFTPDWVTPRHLMAVGFMAIGLALAFWISRSADVRRTERLALYAASFAVAVIGGVLYARASAAPTTAADIRTLRSPFPPDAASIARGKQVYDAAVCAACHGVTGRGDGPNAPTLRPRPADFRVHMAAGHTDGELYTWVSKGVPGTSMQGYENQLSEADRWHVINYIRGFAPQTE